MAEERGSDWGGGPWDRFPEPDVVHRCKESSCAPSEAYGHAVSTIAALEGHWFAVAPEGEYATRIRFCPWCGEQLDALGDAPGIYRVLRELEPHMRRSVIDGWLREPNTRLAGLTPLQALAHGEQDAVLLAVQDVTGGAADETEEVE